ncbi:MAG: manganese efflux pump MntP family protein [Bacteroidota bacterium]
MDFLTLLILAIGLSFDSFAVSISSGVARTQMRFFSASKIAFSLAFFQAMMPFIGWIIGVQIIRYVKNFDHWVAFGLLLLLGAKMILESLKAGENKGPFNPLHFGTLILMSVATSIDAFVVGISFGFLKMNIWLSIFVIGVVTYVISMLGILFGKNTGAWLGKWAEIAGGIILIGIGTKILIEHLSS